MHRVLFYLAALLCLCKAEELTFTTVDLMDADPSAARTIGSPFAPIDQYPYTVQIVILRRYICSGTLLTRHHVLSAAHCFVNEYGDLANEGLYRVQAGAETIINATDSQLRDVARIVVHPNFNHTSLDSDLAVLLLNSPLNLNPSVQTAVLPAQGSDLSYDTFLVSVGWGETRGIGVNRLRDTLVQKVNFTECKEDFSLRFNNVGEVTQNTMCAGWPGFTGFTICVADSGSPLVLKYNHTLHVVVGLTSWSPPSTQCSQQTFKTVNVRLSNFYDWINNTVSNELAISSAPALSLTNTVMLIASLLASVIILKDE